MKVIPKTRRAHLIKYLQFYQALIVNNSININKTNNYLSPHQLYIFSGRYT